MFKIGIGSPRIGLALGSGGAKGWAHVGVLEALHEAGIPIDIVVGSSAGGLAAAFYACNDMVGLRKLAEESSSVLKTVRYLDFQLREKGLITGRRFFDLVRQHLKVRSFKEMSRPLGVVATSLTDLEEIHICEGSLLPALRASCAIPGFMTPLVTATMQLADGGILNPVPVNLAYKLGADIVIAVDLGAFNAREGVRSILGNLNRSIEIMSNRIRLLNRIRFPADLYLEPYLPDYGFLDFHRTEKAIEVGRAVVENNLAKIRKTVRWRPLQLHRLQTGIKGSSFFNLSFEEEAEKGDGSEGIYKASVIRGKKWL